MSLIHSLTHSHTHSLTHSLTRSLTHTLADSPTHSRTQRNVWRTQVSTNGDSHSSYSTVVSKDQHGSRKQWQCKTVAGRSCHKSSSRWLKMMVRINFPVLWTVSQLFHCHMIGARHQASPASYSLGKKRLSLYSHWDRLLQDILLLQLAT